MAYDGWMQFAGNEIINVARTARLASALGIDALRVKRQSVEWIESTVLGVGGFGLGGFGLIPFGSPSEFGDITLAPWYDANEPASAEFAGFYPLSVVGLDDSTHSSTPVEYTVDGGHSGSPRNETLTLVFNGALLASTERGAEFGRRWLTLALRAQGDRTFCSGGDLRYFRYADIDAPIAYRRDVRLTRGLSITGKRRRRCYSVWMATFTMNAADPYEYESSTMLVSGVGTSAPEGPGLVDPGGETPLTLVTCPSYDYTPLYDPLYPALEAPPGVPDFYPQGWEFIPGAPLVRRYVRVEAPGSSFLTSVPVVILNADAEIRYLRVGIWDADHDSQCSPLFSAVVSYIPSGVDLYLDGEQKVAYVWDGFSPYVQRADSLVYSDTARPVVWPAFSQKTDLVFAIDVLAGQSSIGVEASLTLVPKSD